MGLVSTTDYIKQLIESNKTVVALPDYPINDVFYGDQEQVAQNVTVCVDPGPLNEEQLYGSRKQKLQMRHYVMVYIKTLENVQLNRRICDIIAEHVANLINAHPRLDGTALEGRVVEILPGYVLRGNSILRSSRLTVTSTVSTILPQSGG